MRQAFDPAEFERNAASVTKVFSLLIQNYVMSHDTDPHRPHYRQQYINAFIYYIKHLVENYNNRELPEGIRKASLMSARSHNDTLQLTLQEHGASSKQSQPSIDLGKRLIFLYTKLCTSRPMTTPSGDGPEDEYCDASKLTMLT